MKNCENCNSEHDGSYGSGRFCSTKCARGFSTKAKRKEINEKVSKILIKEPYKKICPECGKEFKTKRKKYIYCSRSCDGKGNMTEEVKLKISKNCKGKNAGSKNGMYGKSPKNTKHIRVTSFKHTGNKVFNVRSSYEKIFVNKINENNLISNFTYEPKQFKVKYKDEKGIQRTYQPDFLLKNEIIEIKNKWSAKLKETKIKKEAFKKAFPNIKYQIICW